MTILYFGNYDPEYARNRIILSGLRKNGVTVIECRTASRGLRAVRELVHSFRGISASYDLVIVGYSDARFTVPLAWFLSKKPIVWDVFYSLYDSWIYDRKLAGRHSLKAAYYWLLDWLGCALSDRILLDTNEHIRYFSRTFGVSSTKCVRVLIGADDSLFHP